MIELWLDVVSVSLGLRVHLTPVENAVVSMGTRNHSTLQKRAEQRQRGPLCWRGKRGTTLADESPAILTSNHNLVISTGPQNPNRHWKHKQRKGEAHGSRFEQEREMGGRYEDKFQRDKGIVVLWLRLVFSCWWSILCAVVCAEMMPPLSSNLRKLWCHQLHCSN